MLVLASVFSTKNWQFSHLICRDCLMYFSITAPRNIPPLCLCWTLLEVVDFFFEKITRPSKLETISRPGASTPGLRAMRLTVEVLVIGLPPSQWQMVWDPQLKKSNPPGGDCYWAGGQPKLFIVYMRKSWGNRKLQLDFVRYLTFFFFNFSYFWMSIAFVGFRRRKREHFAWPWMSPTKEVMCVSMFFYLAELKMK